MCCLAITSENTILHLEITSHSDSPSLTNMVKLLWEAGGKPHLSVPWAFVSVLWLCSQRSRKGTHILKTCAFKIVTTTVQTMLKCMRKNKIFACQIFWDMKMFRYQWWASHQMYQYKNIRYLSLWVEMMQTLFIKQTTVQAWAPWDQCVYMYITMTNPGKVLLHNYCASHIYCIHIPFLKQI